MSLHEPLSRPYNIFVQKNVLPRFDVLETGDVPILFCLSQMKNLGLTIELDPKGDKITC